MSYEGTIDWKYWVSDYFVADAQEWWIGKWKNEFRFMMQLINILLDLQIFMEKEYRGKGYLKLI